LEVLEGRYGNTRIVASFPAYHISMLTLEFLNPATRTKQLNEQHLVKITAK
jgi:hypothetical protein